MKKLLSIILSAVMLLTVSVASVSAFAATNSSIETTAPANLNITVQVNGKTTKEITFERDKDNDRVITFTYNGDGKLIGWEFPGLVEGQDYIILSDGSDSNPITIEIINGYEGDVIANAIVEEETSAPAESTTAAPAKDDAKVSPKTGAAAAGVVAMGAGVAILAASRRKRDAE